jgi:hypothetical protein
LKLLYYSKPSAVTKHDHSWEAEGSRKKENICFEKDNSTRKNSQKKFDRLAKYIYYIEISLNTSFLSKEFIQKRQQKKHVR